MFLTYEAPFIRPAAAPAQCVPAVDYARRFGATPPWLDDLQHGLRQALLRSALRRGVPLTAADACCP